MGNHYKPIAVYAAILVHLLLCQGCFRIPNLKGTGSFSVVVVVSNGTGASIKLNPIVLNPESVASGQEVILRSFETRNCIIILPDKSRHFVLFSARANSGVALKLIKLPVALEDEHGINEIVNDGKLSIEFTSEDFLDPNRTEHIGINLQKSSGG